MNPLLNTLLRFAISANLQDKDEFVNKVAAFLEEKVGANEDQAKVLSEKVLLAMSTAKDQLELMQIISAIKTKNTHLEGKIDELSKSIDELKEYLNKK